MAVSFPLTIIKQWAERDVYVHENILPSQSGSEEDQEMGWTRKAGSQEALR